MSKIIETNLNLFKSLFPKRKRETNKSDYGHAIIVGGSKLYGGAPLLSFTALSSLSMGAGYSSLYVPKSLWSVYVGREPQLIVNVLPEFNGHLKASYKTYNELAKKANSIAFGMGVGVNKSIYKIVSYLLKNYSKTLILDADALNSIAKYGTNILLNHSSKLILTPHIKEFSRLSGLDINEIKSSPDKYALMYAKKWNCILVLKDAFTYISDGNSIYVNKTGNASLAKAGSGDILSGILCGLFAQNLSNDNLLIAACGSYILGRSAEMASKTKSEYSVLASDIIENIGLVIKELN